MNLTNGHKGAHFQAVMMSSWEVDAIIDGISLVKNEDSLRENSNSVLPNAIIITLFLQ